LDLLCLRSNNTHHHQQQQQLSHSNHRNSSRSSSSSSRSSIWHTYCYGGSIISKSLYRWSGYQTTHDSDDDYEGILYDTTTTTTTTTTTVCSNDSLTNRINRCTSIDGNFSSILVNGGSTNTNSNNNIIVHCHSSIVNPMID